MIKDKIELIRDGQRQALLTWHKSDGEGGFVPIAMEFAETLAAEKREQIAAVCARPLNIREGSELKKAFSGSSKHFLALPKALAQLGFRTRVF